MYMYMPHIQLLGVLDAVGGSRYSVYDISSAINDFETSPVVEIEHGPANVSALVDLEAELRLVVSTC